MQVGFESLALRVSSIELGKCEARVMRAGLFGDITVQWKAGHPSGGAPPGISPGSGEKRGSSHMNHFFKNMQRKISISLLSCAPVFLSRISAHGSWREDQGHIAGRCCRSIRVGLVRHTPHQCHFSHRFCQAQVKNSLAKHTRWHSNVVAKKAEEK